MRCVCWRRVPLELARAARHKSGGQHIDRAVLCQLSVHDDGHHHFGFLSDADKFGAALWLRWRGTSEVELVVLPDCPVAAPGGDGEGCCLFADHVKQHTWEDTPEKALCTS